MHASFLGEFDGPVPVVVGEPYTRDGKWFLMTEHEDNQEDDFVPEGGC